jgi:hypothetical protein
MAVSQGAPVSGPLSNSSPHGEFPRQSGWRRRETSFVMAMCLAHFAFIRRARVEERGAGGSGVLWATIGNVEEKRASWSG